MIGSVEAVANRPAISRMSRGAVAADVVDADVEQVRAVAGLRAGDLDAVCRTSPASIASRNALEPLALVRSPIISTQASCRNGTAGTARRRAGSGGGLRGVGAQAARPPRRPGARCSGVVPQQPPTRRGAELGDERGQRVGQLLRGQRVDGAVRAELRQAGVGHHRQREPGVAGQVAQVLAHLGRAGGAVEPDQVDAERLQRGQRGADLGAEQHRAGGLDGDVGDQRHRPAGRRPSPACAPMIADLACSRSWQVSTMHRVGAAVEQAGDLLLVGVAQRRRSGTWPSVGSLVPGPTEPSTQRGRSGVRVAVGDLAGERGAGLGQLADPVGDVVLGEVGPVGAEGVGLDRVGAGLEVGVVDAADDVGRVTLRISLQPSRPSKSSRRQVGGLQHRAHRPVGDDDALARARRAATDLGGFAGHVDQATGDAATTPRVVRRHAASHDRRRSVDGSPRRVVGWAA